MGTKTVRERKDIPEKYKWNLESIYSDEAIWEEDLKRVGIMAEHLTSFSGRLTESSDTLLEAMELVTEMERIMSMLASYAHMRQDEDTSIGKYQEMFGRLMSTYAKVSASLSFMTPELLAEDPEKIWSYVAENENLKLYGFSLEKTLRMKAHILSAAEERIMAELSEITGASDRTYSMLNNADLVFGTIKDEKGQEFELTQGNYIGFMESPNRRVREDAFTALYQAYKNHINTTASLYDTNVKANVINARLRGFDSARMASLYPENIDESVYDNLLSVINKNLPLFHRYISLRKKLLNLDELKMFDVYAPLVTVPEGDYPYEKGVELMLEALAPLGEDYVSQVKKGVEDRWLDVYENKGKRSGAYSSGCYDSNPFILLNYDNKLNDVLTLVHEMGHSMHSFYSHKNQPPVYGSYTIFVAEVASTVNENLLLRHLLKVEYSKEMKLYLLNRFLESFRATVFRQSMFAEFELMTHRYVEEGGTLTAEWLCNTYDQLNSKFFGPAISPDEMIKYEWSRIPHFYSAFYVYQYATGFSSAVAIANKILEEGEPAVKAYKEFLSTGGSMYPVDELKIAGVDMSTPKPIEDAMKVFEEFLDEFEALL